MKEGRLPILGNEQKSAGETTGETSCGTGITPILGESPLVYGDKDFSGNVLLVTLGCAKNLVDSEIMLGSLKQRGFRSVEEPEQADLIVVNTCAFLESAVKEGIDKILELAEYKENGRCRRLIVAGCMVERYRKQLEETLPEVDRFLSTDELLSVADESATTSECFDQARRPYFLYDESLPRVRSTGSHSAFVKIAEGCDRPCAFCIIPKIRGAFRSRSIASVSHEARALVLDGVKELNLVAQDLTAYGGDFPGNRGIKSELPSLLRSFRDLRPDTQNFWVRLFYAYPVGVSEELIREIIENPVVCNYLDLPLQHISHSVLKCMKRPLGEKGTRGLIEKVRSIAPELALRTTFVLGFPGETEEDVQSLEHFVSEGHFTHVGAFAYSQESEAESFSFPNQVAEEEREERRGRIMAAQQAVVEARLKAQIGSVQRILVEGAHPESELLLVGRTESQGPETDGEVILNCLSDDLLGDREAVDMREFAGRFGRVEITEVTDYDLIGTLLSVE